jgi:hypothetical protein
MTEAGIIGTTLVLLLWDTSTFSLLLSTAFIGLVALGAFVVLFGGHLPFLIIEVFTDPKDALHRDLSDEAPRWMFRLVLALIPITGALQAAIFFWY